MNRIIVRIAGLVVVGAIIVILVLVARRREPASGKLLVQIIGGKPGAWNLKERMDGFTEGVQGTDIELAKVQYNQENSEIARQVAEAALTANPNLRGFFGSNAFAGPGAALAVKGAGKKRGEVHVVAFDTTDDILDLIAEGYIDCTLAQNTREMGRLSVEKLLEFARQYRQNKSFDRPPKGKDVIDTGVTIVWPKDVPKYRAKAAKPKEGAEPTPPETGKGGKKMRFALVPKSIGHPYWEGVRKGMEETAERLGVEAKFWGPPEASVDKQITIIETLISQGYDGIAISPNDPESVKKVIKEAMDKGTAVVTFDSDSPDSDRLLYIGTDNREGGRVGAKAMIKILGAKKQSSK